jgi:short-subunit dehydrogenase
MEASPAVEAAFHGLRKGKRIVIPGFTNKLLAVLVRLAPKRLVLKVTRFLEEKK